MTLIELKAEVDKLVFQGMAHAEVKVWDNGDLVSVTMIYEPEEFKGEIIIT